MHGYTVAHTAHWGDRVRRVKNSKCLAPIWDLNHWIQLRRQRRFAELFPANQTSGLVEA